MTNPLGFWKGKQGDDYVHRNSLANDNALSRQFMWQRILAYCAPNHPKRILEVGCNIGRNLSALNRVTHAELHGVEPNDAARQQLLGERFIDPVNILAGQGSALPLRDFTMDLAFTCGVLIHIPPDELRSVCAEICRVSRRYVVAIEYFSAQPTMIPYRGENDKLWKRDFGKFYLDNFPGLTPVGCGFEWSATTGLDDLTWWVFRK